MTILAKVYMCFQKWKIYLNPHFTKCTLGEKCISNIKNTFQIPMQMCLWTKTTFLNMGLFVKMNINYTQLFHKETFIWKHTHKIHTLD